MADGDTFKVLMLGGRRCGKTSMLAMIIQEFNKNNYGNLNLFPSLEKGDPFGKKIAEMRKLIAKDKFEEEDGGTIGIDEFGMSISLKKYAKSKLDITFTDIPGEWMKGGIGIEDQMKKLLKANAFLVAIDTPFLMEEYGAYDEDRNFCFAVCTRLQSLGETENQGKRLVLFVPLKCEKYLHEGRMGEVNDKIKEAYKAAFTFFEGQDKYEVAIAPVVTMGVFEFLDFKRDENGEVVTTVAVDRKTGQKIKRQQGIYKKIAHKSVPFNPHYCEQPIYYLLAYLLTMAADSTKTKTGGGIFAWLANIFFKIPMAENWLKEKKEILKQLKTRGDGYEIIHDPLHFK